MLEDFLTVPKASAPQGVEVSVMPPGPAQIFTGVDIRRVVCIVT